MYRAVDDFLPNFDEIRFYADIAPYSDIENPIDKVTYPDICLFIPIPLINLINKRLDEVEGRDVSIHSTFMRLSKKGAPCPHQAHTDLSMGQKSLMLYLNNEEDIPDGAGTSFLQHKELGIDSHPFLTENIEVVQRDANTPEVWDVVELCEMRPNRACIFDAELFHRAEPIGGFGDNRKNGRLVLTAFYSLT